MQISIKSTITITDFDSDVTTKEHTKTFTLTEFHRRTYNMANGDVVNAWDPKNVAGDSQAMADFDVLVIISDQDIEVEATVQVDSANANNNTFKVASGLPFVLGADDAFYAHSATTAALAASSGLINRLRIQNNSGATANVSLYLGT